MTDATRDFLDLGRHPKRDRDRDRVFDFDRDFDERRLSYLDFGGDGLPLLALHGHLSEAATWRDLAAALRPEWRVIAPDQRGHGDSDRTATYSRIDYVKDAVALLDHLDIGRAVVVGHSGGGVTAYQLAALHPERVVAVVNEDGPAEIPEGESSLSFVHNLPYEDASRDALLVRLGPLGPLFADTLRPNPDGSWRLPFHPADTILSEQGTHGDHWAEVLASACPMLLLSGRRSPLIGQLRAMAERRPGTRLVELDTDHFVHAGDPEGFGAAVRDFLSSLDRSTADLARLPE
jgi:pimeloyl-ACP methyl ester carboxylesterase